MPRPAPRCAHRPELPACSGRPRHWDCWPMCCCGPPSSAAEFERQRGQRLAALSQQREDGPTPGPERRRPCALRRRPPAGRSVHRHRGQPQGPWTWPALRAFWQATTGLTARPWWWPVTSTRPNCVRWPNACWAVGRRPLTGGPDGTPAPQPLAARTVLVHQAGAAQTASPSSAPARAPAWIPPRSKVHERGAGRLFTSLSRINQQLRVRAIPTASPGFQMGRERGSFGLYGSVRSDVVDCGVEGHRPRDGGHPQGADGRGRAGPRAQCRDAGAARPVRHQCRRRRGYANQWVIGQPIEALRALPAQLGSVNAADALRAAASTWTPPADRDRRATGRQIGPQLKGARGACVGTRP